MCSRVRIWDELGPYIIVVLLNDITGQCRRRGRAGRAEARARGDRCAVPRATNTAPPAYTMPGRGSPGTIPTHYLNIRTNLYHTLNFAHFNLCIMITRCIKKVLLSRMRYNDHFLTVNIKFTTQQRLPIIKLRYIACLLKKHGFRTVEREL